MTGKAASRPAPGEMGRVLRPTAKALPGDARGHNRSLILRTLFHQGPIARADLARATDLTRVTISDLVTGLLADGLVEECGLRPGQRMGKPATLVRLRADAFHILAVDLNDTENVRGALLDLNGSILRRTGGAMGGRTGAAAVDALAEVITGLREAATRPLLGVGIGSPGIVDTAGTIVEAPNLGWWGVPLSDILKERFSLPVYVANDANTAALAEFTFGGASDSGLMVVTVGRGVGAGIVIDGALLRGHRHAAGEVGHVTVQDDGEQCGCGRRGCLETVLSTPALRRAVALAGPETSDAVLASVGRSAGVALAPVVSALNLKEIVLAGPADLLDGSLRAEALHTIRTRTMPIIGEDLELRMAMLGEEVTLIGAAVLVLSGELGVT